MERALLLQRGRGGAALAIWYLCGRRDGLNVKAKYEGKTPVESRHCHILIAKKRCHLIRRYRDSFPSRGSLFFRQKAFAAEAKLFSKTQNASAEHCSALAFSHIQTNLWKTHARGPRSWPRKVMASASGPVLADTTQPSWNTFTGGWPNSFLHCFTSSLMRSPSV